MNLINIAYQEDQNARKGAPVAKNALVAELGQQLRDMGLDVTENASIGPNGVTASKPGDAGNLYPVPAEDAFPAGVEYLDAPDIRTIAGGLILEHSHLFGWLENYSVMYRWKAAGGSDRGKPKLGECKKANGHDRYLYGKRLHFFITLSADHVRDYQLSPEQVEALIFHELNHASTDEKGKPVVLPHEFEGFRAELIEYGPWSADLQIAEDGFQRRLEGL